MNNIFVDENENQLKININPAFYGHASVMFACNSLADRFWVYFDERNGRYRVTLKPKNNDKVEEKIGMEFFNKMLEEMHEAVSKINMGKAGKN
jgi:hypothetical protein